MLLTDSAIQVFKFSMTLFEKIVARQISANIVYETEEVIAFHDIAPQAPTHILVIPKKIITRIATSQEEDVLLLGKLLLAAAEVARKMSLEQTGYRLVINNGRDAGEAVPHLHIHVLGGRKMAWPPG